MVQARMEKYRKKGQYVEISKIEEFVTGLRREADRLENNDRLLTANQAAQYLQVHRYELYKMIENQGLPCLKLGARKFRFQKKALNIWIAKVSVRWLKTRQLQKKKVKSG